MSSARGSLRRQLIVLSATATAGAVVLLVLLVQLLLDRTTTRAVDRVLDERIDAVISSAEAASSGDRLVVPDARLDAGVAIYDGAGHLVAGSPPSSTAATYAELAAEAVGASSGRTVTLGDDSIIRSQPFRLPLGVDGTVIVTERLKPYESAEHYALAISVGTGLLAIVASAGLAAFVSRRALAPVVTMAATAEDWSEHDLTSRFDLGEGGNELTALGHTLDSLLDKVASAIRSEQRLTAELAHELRTPLTSLQGTADLMAMRSDLDPDLREDVEELRAASRRMAETITVLLDLARSTAGATGTAAAGRTTCRVGEVLDDVLSDLGTRREVVTIAEPAPRELRLGLPHALAARALGPVLDNAVRYGQHVLLTVLPEQPGHAGRVRVLVDDDGDGVDADVRDVIFEPGRTAGRDADRGSGLGLPLARRIARTAGGDVRLDPAGHGGHGARFVVELPSD